MLKEKVLLTKNVSELYRFSALGGRNSLDRHLNILLSSVYSADIPKTLYEMSSGGKKSIKI